MRHKRRKPDPSAAMRVPFDDAMAIDPRAIEKAFFPFLFDDDEEGGPGYEREGYVAVVSVEGPLMQRGSWFFDGYDDVAERFKAALADESARAVMLRIDSPGGTVAGMIETVRSLRAAKEAAGKPVFAYAAESAFSAGYALATVADQIWLPDSGGVGSVGVICALTDVSKMNEKLGVHVVVLSSGDQKADGHPDVPLSKEVVARVRGRIDQLAQLFAEEVAAARAMTAKAVLALQAACFYGADAVTAGLADHVGSFADALTALGARADAASKTAPPAGGAKRQEATQMKGIATILGLREDATEAEIVAALSREKTTTAELLHLTGKATLPEALGVISAWKSESGQMNAVREDLKKAHAAQDEREMNEAIDRTYAEGRLLPPEREEQKAFGKKFGKDALLASLATRTQVVDPSALKPKPPAERKAGASAQGAEDPETAYAMKRLGMTAEDMAKAENEMRERGLVRTHEGQV